MILDIIFTAVWSMLFILAWKDREEGYDDGWDRDRYHETRRRPR